jgi:DNA-directed RNA polymerase I subunit RPA1
MTRVEYCQLVYECVAMDCSGGWEVWLEPPAILKPQPLWTGKQVFTAVLMHYTRDQLPFTMAADSKVPLEMWGKSSGEGKMHIWRNHLVAGCVDKATFGKYGLLHVFHVRKERRFLQLRYPVFSLDLSNIMDSPVVCLMFY